MWHMVIHIIKPYYDKGLKLGSHVGQRLVCCPTFRRWTDALGQRTGYRLDGLGRIQGITHPDGSREQFVWNEQGLLGTHTDTARQSQYWHYTVRGQIKSHTDASGKTTQAQYNPRQQLSALTLTKGTAQHQFIWDASGRLQAEKQPDGVEKHLHYNTQGWLVQRDIIGFNEKGSLEKPPVRSIQYCYDADGRLTNQQNLTSSLHYSYNSLGQLDTATRTPTSAGMELGLGIHNLRFEFDKLGRLIHEAGDNGELYWAWDGLSNLQSLTLPQGQQVGYQRYGSGHVHGMAFDGVDILNFERDDLHREVLRTQGQHTSKRAYDKRGRVSRQRAIMRTAGESEKILVGRDYHYNPAGELERINDNVRGESQYDYDPAGRFTGYYQTGKNAASEHFAWDAADNLLPSRGQGEALATPAIQGNRLLHTLLARAGNKTPLSFQYDYDAFGRVVVKNPGLESRMRENRPYGSEGGKARAFPTPIGHGRYPAGCTSA